MNISEFSGLAIQLSVFKKNRIKFGNSSSHTVDKTHEAKSIPVKASLVFQGFLQSSIYLHTVTQSLQYRQTIFHLEFFFFILEFVFATKW